jgi:hypothetical protein
LEALPMLNLYLGTGGAVGDNNLSERGSRNRGNLERPAAAIRTIACIRPLGRAIALATGRHPGSGFELSRSAIPLSVRADSRRAMALAVPSGRT